MTEQRWYFDTDDDGHVYLLPLEVRDDFREMLENGEKDDWEEFNETYWDYAIGTGESYFSFTDPKEIK